MAVVDFFVLKFLYRKLEMTDEDAEIRQKFAHRYCSVQLNCDFLKNESLLLAAILTRILLFFKEQSRQLSL